MAVIRPSWPPPRMPMVAPGPIGAVTGALPRRTVPRPPPPSAARAMRRGGPRGPPPPGPGWGPRARRASLPPPVPRRGGPRGPAEGGSGPRGAGGARQRRDRGRQCRRGLGRGLVLAPDLDEDLLAQHARLGREGQAELHRLALDLDDPDLDRVVD